MRTRGFLKWSSVLCLSAILVQAQETNELAVLKKQLEVMQEKFEQQQRELRQSFEQMVRQQQEQIEALRKQIGNSTVSAASARPGTNAPPGSNPTNALAATASAAEVQELKERFKLP